MKKIIWLVVLLIIIGAVGGWTIWSRSKERAPSSISSFADCAGAGYPVMESSPRQCKTPDGRIFAEELPSPTPQYDNASANNITVDLPSPGAVVGKSFKVTGKARGTWYFEASFPVEVLDSNGKSLARTAAQAKEDWMTENFVPYEANIKIPDSYIGPAVLILRKDNPSGLPQNDASVSFPITIEY